MVDCHGTECHDRGDESRDWGATLLEADLQRSWEREDVEMSQGHRSISILFLDPWRSIRAHLPCSLASGIFEQYNFVAPGFVSRDPLRSSSNAYPPSPRTLFSPKQ